MILYGPSSGLVGIGLIPRISRGGTLMYPPVIEDSVHMAYSLPLQLFGAPYDKIMILGSVVLTPEASNLIYQILFYSKEMADIIIRKQKLHVKIRFPERS